MRQKFGPEKAPAEQIVKDIRRATRRQFSAEEKIRIVLEGVRGEESIAELCRREGIASSMYYGWSKEFLDAGKRRLAGDTDEPEPPLMRSEISLRSSDDGHGPFFTNRSHYLLAPRHNPTVPKLCQQFANAFKSLAALELSY